MGAPPPDGPEQPDDYPSRRDAAVAHLADGDASRAFEALRWALWHPRGGALSPDELAEGIGVLARIAVAMGHRELAEACARGSLEPGDPEAQYDLGYQLIEAGLPAIATTVLARALALAPDSEQVVTELVASLERQLRYAEARDVLEAHGALLAGSFLCRYLLAYNAAMAGDLARTRAVAPALSPDPGDDTQRFMAARIGALLARADRIAGAAPLDGHDLRGWHYVLTGGLLLHRSPHGFDDAMRGRYAWLQDQVPLIRAGLDRLRDALVAWEVAPPCVYAPPGREHEIVAAAAASVLGIPRMPWPAVGVPAPGLVVVHDLGQVAWPALERLIDRRADQVLYAHAAPWTEDAPVAPDVVTLLHQSLVSPWGERLAVEGDERAVVTRPADARDVAELAADVVAAPALDAEAAAHDDLPGLAALIAAIGAPSPARRERMWAGSPVPSNRFL